MLALSGALSVAPQAAPLTIIATVIGWSVAYLRSAQLRAWADALPTRRIIALHAIRWPIGALFVWEASKGQLPTLFAHRAGYGDMAVGVLAVLVASAAWQSRRAVVAFTLFGLLDILVAVGTAMYLVFVAQDPVMLSAFGRMPYPLLPLFIVPSVILTHLIVLRRRF